MARQRGPLKVEGRIGDLSFYKSQDGFMLREKGGVTKKRIMTDPRFSRVRENLEEFARAGKSGRILRKAFESVLSKSGDRLMPARMQRMLMKVVQTDQANERGKRTVANGDLSLLEGFDFNATSSYSNTLKAILPCEIDRVSGELTVDVPAFVPQNKLFPPAGTSHYQFIVAGAEVDFETENFEIVEQQSDIRPFDKQLSAPLTLSVQLPAASVLPLFLILKIAFFQEVTGEKYPLQSGQFNCATLVKVDIA